MLVFTFAKRSLSLILVAALSSCNHADHQRPVDQPIELPSVVDASGAYQTEPFTRTVQDVQLFEGEAPCILITQGADIGRVGRWQTQILLIAKAGPGEVSYDAITIVAYSGYDADSGGTYVAQHYWASDVNGDGTDDLLVLTWRWGGPGWFEGDRGHPPVDEALGVRVITREATDRGHPLGIASDKSYGIDELKAAGVTADHLQSGLDTCNSVWRARLARIGQMLAE